MPRFLAAASSADPQALSGIAGWAVDIMNDLGGFGAASLIALENLFPPLPSEVILPLAGFTAGTGNASFTLLGAILWCTAGSVVGAWALYGVGALLGSERASSWANSRWSKPRTSRKPRRSSTGGEPGRSFSAE